MADTTKYVSILEIDSVRYNIKDSDARNKANTAKTTADTALNTANNAETTANTAKTTADNALKKTYTITYSETDETLIYTKTTVQGVI